MSIFLFNFEEIALLLEPSNNSCHTLKAKEDNKKTLTFVEDFTGTPKKS